ncbi:MAG: phosphoglycerate kinase [Thermoplasmata archaeon]|nr:phosphoglycerate kinase [Thermoplasmata archaeon]
MLPTMDEFDFENKSVIVRVDINSPLNPDTLEIMDTWRIERCLPTIKELISKNARVIIMAHQGRPGKWDFTGLDKHAEMMSRIGGIDIKFVPDIYGEEAIKSISEMRGGEAIMLDNVRKYKEEMEKKEPEEHAKTEMVQTLSKYADAFVNDAFAAAHRKQCSLVGFIPVLPSFAGRLLQKEVEMLDHLLSNASRPRVFIFGGSKYENAIDVIKNLLERDVADKILLGGVPANAFLASIGKIDMEVEGEMKEIADKFGERLLLPVDMVYEDGEWDVEEKRLPGYDIGSKSIELFREEIENAGSILISGPMGMFEKEEYSKGTKEIIKAIASSRAFSIAGGGHTIAAINMLGLASKFSYISTGGGALERYIMGKKLPVIDALIKFKK